VVEAAAGGPVVYGVPGSPHVGERSVAAVVARAAAEGVSAEVIPGGSFLDLVWSRVGLDPITSGAQILDGRALPDPLPLHLPTVVTQVDRPVVLADVAGTLGKLLPDDFEVLVLDRLGSGDEVVEPVTLAALARYLPGPRTSLYLDPPPVGWHGLVVTNRRLRRECPWDREQTHHTLLRHLIEEAYETVEALGVLPSEAPEGEPDYAAYAHVEEELGDLLLQVVFHATLAREAGVFDVEEVAEMIRRKLVHRHPHVFGDVAAHDAETVLANWEQIKAAEKSRDSLMDDIPLALPAPARADKLQRRAASAGFDWDDLGEVLAKVDEEIGELRGAIGHDDAVTHELGDLLFAVVNVARHVGVDGELALRRANERFEVRFRHVESAAKAAGRELGEMTLEEMDALWEEAKR
jgi:tetrapyrrole methylase family protein/MazG family protein